MISVLLVLTGPALVGPISQSAAGPGDPLGNINVSNIAAGDVTSNSAVMIAQVNRRAAIKVEVSEDPGLRGQKAFQQMILPPPNADPQDPMFVYSDATNLQPDTQYYYRFRHGPKRSRASEIGTFHTAPDPSSTTDVTFEYTGDYDGTGGPDSPAYNDFDVFPPIVDDGARGEAGINFWLDIGDTIYADSRFRASPATTLAEYRAAHAENKSFPNLKELLKSMATYALMDDHEVVNDYAGQTVDPARYAAGRQAFLEAYPVRRTGLPHDPSCAGDPLYRHFQWGTQLEIFLLDERSCRSAEAVAACGGDLAPTLPTAIRTTFPFSLFLSPAPIPGCLAAINDPSRTLLGPVQKAQLKSDLLNSTARHKVVVSEDPIQQFHVLPYDRWEGYAAERNEILDFVSNDALNNVEFATADTHATLINQVAKDNFAAPATVANEVVTGPVATDTFQAEVLAQAGPVGLFAVNLLLDLEGIDCRHLDKNSYAFVEVSAGAGTATYTSKDATGTPIVGQAPPATTCTATYGP